MKRNWKKVRPTSLLHALELCVDYAREVHNLSVERIADRMGETTHHALYKWLAEGGMPMRKLRPFEHACGCKFGSRWVAMSGDLLTIDIPTGRSGDSHDVMALQETLNDAVGALLAFYSGNAQLRLLKVIEALSGHEVFGIRLKEVAAAVNADQPKVFRDLRTLEAGGWAKQDESSLWRLGPKGVQILANFHSGVLEAQQRVNEISQRYTRKP